MTAIRRTYVDTLGGQVHAHQRAGIGTPIVLIHQTALSARSLDPLLNALNTPNPLVALDIPGFGNSTQSSGWPSIADYAAELLAAIDALGIKRFHLFGHHTGASIAVEIAANQPARVASAMLCGLPLMTAVERAGFATQLGESITPSRDGSHLIENWRYTLDHNPGCDGQTIHDAVTDMLRNWRARPQAYRAVATHETAAVASRISAPVLLLSTAEDYFRDHLDRARAIFPAAPIALTGGDNLPTTADPVGLSAAIQSFLATLGAETPSSASTKSSSPRWRDADIVRAP